MCVWYGLAVLLEDLCGLCLATRNLMLKLRTSGFACSALPRLCAAQGVCTHLTMAGHEAKPGGGQKASARATVLAIWCRCSSCRTTPGRKSVCRKA